MLFLYVVSLSICEPEDEDDVDEGADEDENIVMMMMMTIMVMTMMTSIRRGHRPRHLGGYLKYPPPNPPACDASGWNHAFLRPFSTPPPARLRLILPHLSAFVFWTPSLFDVF